MKNASTPRGLRTGSDSEIDLFKAITGKRIDEFARAPTGDATLGKILKTKRSSYPLVRLGWSQEGEVLLTEEERLHFHILGLPGKGKSKLLELLARHDIDRLHRWHQDRKRKKVPGICLIDSSDFGNTFYKVLRHCRHIGFDKVCIVDPNDFYAKGIEKVPVINPFGKLEDKNGVQAYGSIPSVVSSGLANVFRVLWDTEDFSKIARINQYLRAIVEVIHAANGTLSDVVYFTSRYFLEHQAKRDEILNLADPRSPSRLALEEMFYHTNQSTFNVEFRSTIRRIDPLFEKPFPYIVSSNQNAIDFAKLISEGWIILCNLDPQIWDVSQQRLLGTLVINESIQAMYSLVRNGYNVPFYLYIDEVGRYATEVLSEVIDYKRTSNIRLVMAHQRYDQIKIENVRSAIESAPNKVMFYTERFDRDRMVMNMYGGDLPQDMVSYTLSQELQKQKAVIKLGQMRPRVTRIVDLPDVPADKAADHEFKVKLYQQPWYRSRSEAEHEIDARFQTTTARTGGFGEKGRNRIKGSGKRKVRDREAAIEPVPAQPERKGHFDD